MTGRAGLLIAAIVLLTACGCAGTRAQGHGEPDPFDEEETACLADPIMPVNRAFFVVNDKLYFWVLKPVASVYGWVLPECVRLGVRNFGQNLATPRRTVSCLLQGNLRGAGRELGRFGINTTIGVLGLCDPAYHWFEMRMREEDIGQAFGVWGLGPGFYIDLPVFGPSSLRDAVGKVGDTVLDPAIVIPGMGAVKMINHISLHPDDYTDIKRNTLDPYTALRNGYHQRRIYLIDQRE